MEISSTAPIKRTAKARTILKIDSKTGSKPKAASKKASSVKLTADSVSTHAEPLVTKKKTRKSTTANDQPTITSPKRKSGRKVTSTAALTKQPVSAQQWQQMVAEAAYFRAEQRHFAPGFATDDWFAAEQDLAMRYQPT